MKYLGLFAAGLCAALIASVTVMPAGVVMPTAKAAEKDDPKKRRRMNRAAAGAFATIMPAAPEDWRAGKTTTDWRREGAQARRRYRHKENGNEVVVSLEIRMRGLTYKKELFDAPKKASARGYKVVAFGDRKVLLRDSPVRREVRTWIDERILVYMKGRADLAVFESLIKAIDFDKLKEVK